MRTQNALWSIAEAAIVAVCLAIMHGAIAGTFPGWKLFFVVLVITMVLWVGIKHIYRSVNRPVPWLGFMHPEVTRIDGGVEWVDRAVRPLILRILSTALVLLLCVAFAAGFAGWAHRPGPVIAFFVMAVWMLPRFWGKAPATTHVRVTNKALEVNRWRGKGRRQASSTGPVHYEWVIERPGFALEVVKLRAYGNIATDNTTSDHLDIDLLNFTNANRKDIARELME
ncbi:hypothetical protein [Corynebacterium cystitidis]|uniref:Uncharacterized protein n=1 Tax=Corynebacterium cystitidis DSM 20524 TaxID=1121357 RepID=A0A1H9TD17_9CORY|nr:hypothetical protein [Corynebacterium cystitidis]WJY83565.1 hypothetical protein CCYS_13405 [Corynebacterium cystitidis DSM 20524]SER95061.1 hypothetical protein SAMN05661109_01421 [Corynebacterium cystitidis DSM 20524]SNV92028.1 Uncharacterised protein [Corynebacterium cystitidis]